MATINFLYRSSKENAPLNLRLLFRHNNKDYILGAKTNLIIYTLNELSNNRKLSGKYYWNKLHLLKRVKDISVSNKQTEVNIEINKLENFLLDAFNKTSINQINKEWLQSQIDKYYNPVPKNNALASNELTKNIDFYINSNKSQITTGTIKQYKTLKNKIIKYEKTKSIKLLVKDINEAFKNDFENYCLENNYSPNTISRNLKGIKTICNYARRQGIEISLQLENVKTKTKKAKNIYLTLDDISQIESINKNTLTESLKNARDWLIISCFSGQRVSDFMRFSDDMIRIENTKHLIEFTQKKTNKIMTIPLHKKVLEILKRNKGKFPRPISDQKYNDYIKEVCRIAGLTEKVNGSKKIEIEQGSKVFRKVTKNYEKWELVSSHIGRRSFATNFYGQIPTTLLINVTGHSTEAMFLDYIGKSNKDLAMELTNYFD